MYKKVEELGLDEEVSLRPFTAEMDGPLRCRTARERLHYFWTQPRSSGADSVAIRQHSRYPQED